jgi:hypothetical protein
MLKFLLSSADKLVHSLFSTRQPHHLNPIEGGPVPTLKLTGGKSPARSKPAAKPAARKSAAKSAPSKSAPTRKAASKSAAKPAAAAPAQASTNGSQTRGPKLPEGWSKADFNRVVKDMQKAKAAREAAEARLKEAQEAANGLALELLDEGLQMSVISTELELSRQWMYTMLKKREEEQGIPAPVRSRSASKPAAKRTGTARKRPAAKTAAKSASKSAAKRTPARKAPAKKPVTTTGRGRVVIR